MKNNHRTYKLSKDSLPAQATHPGQLIADEIEFRNIKQKEFAEAMDLAPNFVNEIIHGKRNITPAIAMKLELTLGIEANYWMRLQSKYSMDIYKIQNHKSIERLRRHDPLIKNLPTPSHFEEKVMEKKLVYKRKGKI